VDPAGKAAAATEPTMAAMKGEGDGVSPVEQGPAPDLAGRVDVGDGEARRSHVGAAGRRRGQGGEGRR
jgi:hypothetical protein